MTSNLIILIFPLIVFVGMLLFAEFGHRLGLRHNESGHKVPSGMVDNAVFALFGLILAFTFSGATSRFDARRLLIIKEANIIGTSYLRIDLLAEKDQPTLRNLMRDYLDSRIETFRKIPDFKAVEAEISRSSAMQQQIWSLAIAATRELNNPATTSLLISTLNEMFDVATERIHVAQIHPPTVVFGLLILLSLIAALACGYSMAHKEARSWTHLLCFAITVSLTVYVIIDMEYPRVGLIKVEHADRVLEELRASMN